MFETPEQLLAQIQLGEDSSLELKSVHFVGDKIRGPARDDLADELAAFANASGGVVVLGVDDKRHEVTGIPRALLDPAERFVAEVCSDLVKPALMASIRKLELPGADGEPQAVIRVGVPRSLFVHESPGGYWYRVGSSKRRMAPEYLARLMQQKSQARLIRFDEQVVPQSRIEDLDAKLISRFRTPRTRGAVGPFLRNLGMAREDEEGVLRPTIAGVLLGSREPERWLRHAYIQAVSYRGEGSPGVEFETGYQIDARDITGPIDEQAIEACRFVVRNMRIGASKTVGRLDVPQYDMGAVFEAMINAVVHRDYSMYGTRIRLRVFDSRLELYCPGALPNTLDIESLAQRQSSRNETLASLLAKCRVPKDLEWLKTSRKTLMDRRGEGVALILQRSEKLAKKRPVYEMIDPSELRLTIYAASALDHGGA